MFDTLFTKVLAGVAALGLLVASFLFGFGVGRQTATSPRGLGYGLLEEAEEKIRTSAVAVPDREVLVQGAVRGMLESLNDSYAEYLDPETYISFSDAITGHFTGVGLVLTQENMAIEVISVLPDTPAQQAGIEGGDQIIEVDGEDVEELFLEQVVTRIKGDAGTPVEITVRRSSDELRFTLTRQEIHVPSVESEMLFGRLGLIRVITFLGDTGEQVRKAATDLSQRGAGGLILDLRGNPGGALDAAVEVAGVFLDGGTVVSYEERGRADVVHAAPGGAVTDVPMVVLVDGDSASASEIVAGALQDRGRALLVGARTFGKGSIQRVIPLSDGSAIKLTIAQYRLPSGKFIGEQGITPDVSVLGESDQLARARQILREMLAESPSQQAG